jgi:alkanesulfonate monooxygenase SsuD/methylene tetrahydromethanopterin reductase-like flavin-dependent oxidoreductase (luciferase family)
MPVPVGIKVISRWVPETFPYLDEVVAPFDSIWIADHVQHHDRDVAEGWTMMTYALSRYPDKVCGHEVLCNSFRNPALLAKMVATAQTISGGRVVLGIGAGGRKEEYRSYNWPFPNLKVRIAQMAEAIRVVRTMWSDSPANYDGEYYQINEAHCEPRPNPLPPIMIGCDGEKYSLRVVAELADWWNHLYKTNDNLIHKQNILRAHCKDVGRDYDEITQIAHVGIRIAPNETELSQLINNNPPGDGYFIGTPDQVTEQMLALVDQGIHRITVHFLDAPQTNEAQLFGSTVISNLARV